MKSNLPRIEVSLNRDFIIAFLLLALISSVLHEFGHFVVEKSLDKDMYMTFSAVIPRDHSTFSSSEWLLGLAGGPLVSYSLIYGGLLLLLFSKRFQLLGILLVIINAPTRILSTFDEEKMFSILEIDPNLVYLYLIPLFVLIPIIVVYMSTANQRRYLIIGGLILLSLVFGTIRATLDKEFFIKPFFDGKVFPDIFGINIYMVIMSLIAFALFFGKYGRYLLSDNNSFN